MLLINRNYRLLWAGQTISQLGDFVFNTTLTLWVGTVLLRGRSDAPAAVAALIAVAAAATLLVAPLAGVFVDRWDLRRTMLTTDLIRASLIGAVTVLAFLPTGTLATGATLTLVYVAVFLAMGVAQFFNPARFAVIGRVVAADQRVRAAAIGQSTQAIASILGPPLAAPLLYGVGVRWALLLNACSFLLSYMAVRAVHVEPEAPRSEAAERGSVWAEFLAGLRLVGSSRVVTALIITISIVTLGTAALESLNVFFVTENLHAGTRWFGTLEMALGVGLVAGAAGAGMLGARIGHRRLFSSGLVAAGVGLVIYSQLSHLWSALAVLMVVGFPLAAVNAALTPILLDAVPTTHLGRVIAVINPAQQLASLLGVAAAGWLASTAFNGLDARVAGIEFGRIDTIFLLAGLMVITGGLYASLALRNRASLPHVPQEGAAAVVHERSD
ncbi:MFS transporter [Embleya sp. NPDC005575]|uniref:MFS transporter n=1 Tax=Embleya sp. NPDC005575 TaxID=3156892 RepID=UPI0033BD9EE1